MQISFTKIFLCDNYLFTLFKGELEFSRIFTFSRSFSTFLSTFHPSLFHFSICNTLKSVKRQFYSISIKLLSALYPKKWLPNKNIKNRKKYFNVVEKVLFQSDSLFLSIIIIVSSWKSAIYFLKNSQIVEWKSTQLIID